MTYDMKQALTWVPRVSSAVSIAGMSAATSSARAIVCTCSNSATCCHLPSNMGALVITHTILGVPYYSYSIMGPKTLF